MIVVTEHRAGDEFAELGRDLLTVLARADGFVDGRLGRSPDEPDVWLMVTNWRDAGSMRRGFGSFDAKVAAAAVMVSAEHRVSAFETLLETTGGDVADLQSYRSDE